MKSAASAPTVSQWKSPNHRPMPKASSRQTRGPAAAAAYDRPGIDINLIRFDLKTLLIRAFPDYNWN